MKPDSKATLPEPISILSQLRPRDDTLYTSCGRTILSTARDGFVHGGAQGLFVFQTRILSRYRYFAESQPLHTVGISNIEQHSQLAYYVFETPNVDESLRVGALGPGGRAAAQAIELKLARFVGDGLYESATLTNHTQRPAKFAIELEVDADFADPSETSGNRRQQGKRTRSWSQQPQGWCLNWTYHAEHSFDHQGNSGRACFDASVSIYFEDPDSTPVFDEDRGRVRFEVDLSPHGVWRCGVRVCANMNGRECRPPHRGGSFAADTPVERARDAFLSDSTRICTGLPPLSGVVESALERARNDLASLRLYDLDVDRNAWTVAAGLPVYLSFYGRDTLTAGWQSAMIGPEVLRGSLAEITRTQASTTNDWRDAQPGRFVHQLETAPLPQLGYDPYACYYGSLTTPGFYPFALSALWHWTGDRAQVEAYIEPALKGLAWLDKANIKLKSFYAYKTRSEQGVKNQSWKDSFDAIVYPDGRLVNAPIAPSEFQAFVYASKLRLSEVLWWFDRKDEASKMFHEAMELRKSFNETFWMEDEGCFGMGLDQRGELIRSAGSESIHALGAGIVDSSLVPRTVQRLFAPDLFSGWGIRTLSSRHPAYNPFSYHRGSVWPAEQAACSLGLMRYGLHDRTAQLARTQFEAAALFEYFRLPELFSGHPRDAEHPVPALYPEANSPQAWSASGLFCLIQALLGVFAYAPLRLLCLDPHLPDWLPQLSLNNLRVGDSSVDLRFERKEEGSTGYEILDVRGTLHVVRQPSPWSLTATLTERLVDALTSLLPGR